MCTETISDVLCIQETHRTEEIKTPKIKGMKLVNLRPHKKYGSEIFVRPTTQSAHFIEENDIETLALEIDKCTVTSIYKPPNALFTFKKLSIFNTQKIHFVIGDFNSYHTGWRYEETDKNVYKVKLWAETNKLVLVHD